MKPERLTQSDLSRWEWVWLALLGLVGIGAQIYIALTPGNVLLRWFPTDDAFYYYQVAANIAHGAGATFDGISRTNGFHPLWLLLNIPVFALKGINPFLPLRVVVVLEGLLNFAAGVLLFRGARRVFSPWVGALMAAVWMLSPAIFERVMVGGMETSLNGAFLAWLWERTTVFGEAQPWEGLARKGWLLGLVSGLAILSRLDSVFIVGALWLWLAWKAFRFYGWPRWKEGALALLRAGAPAVVLVGGYLLWGQWYVGNWYPVSAAVKHWWGVKGNTVYGAPHQPRWIDSVRWIRTVPFWWLNGALVWAQHALARVFGAAAGRLRWAVLFWGLLLALGGEPLKRNLGRSLVLLWLAAALAHAAYYEVVPYVGERDWYWVQETFAGVLLMGAVVDAWWQQLARWRPLARRRAFPWAGLALGSLVVLGLSLWHVRAVVRTYPLRPAGQEHIYLRTTHWLETHTEQGTLIGMTGAGAAGYFIRERTIEPLDGLINGYAYLNALKAGRGAAYLSEIGLDYVFAKKFVQTGEPYAEVFKGRLQPVAACPCGEGEKATYWLWRFLPTSP